jgi:23S rRNA (pseudouridine1915-N3)-methyltransferase
MYPIELFTFGRMKLKPCQDLEFHYAEMLRAFARLDVIELSEGRGESAKQLKEEAQKLRPRLLAARCPVLLTPEGRSHSSEAFATWLGARMDRGESIAFAIGSSHGFDPILKAEVKEKLSLSPMTFPHELTRVVFLEQLYRAMTILKGKTYHK